MKTNFKFFFHLILGTAFFSTVVYGLAQGLVEKYNTFFSFSLLSLTVIGIVGMMRSLGALSGTEVQ